MGNKSSDDESGSSSDDNSDSNDNQATTTGISDAAGNGVNALLTFNGGAKSSPNGGETAAISDEEVNSWEDSMSESEGSDCEYYD